MNFINEPGCYPTIELQLTEGETDCWFGGSGWVHSKLKYISALAEEHNCKVRLLDCNSRTIAVSVGTSAKLVK